MTLTPAGASNDDQPTLPPKARRLAQVTGPGEIWFVPAPPRDEFSAIVDALEVAAMADRSITDLADLIPGHIGVAIRGVRVAAKPTAAELAQRAREYAATLHAAIESGIAAALAEDGDR